MYCFSRMPRTSSVLRPKTSRARRVSRTSDPRVEAVPIALLRVSPLIDRNTYIDHPWYSDDHVLPDYCHPVNENERTTALDSAHRPVRGDVDDRPRRHDRQRRPADDPERPRVLAVEPGL